MSGQALVETALVLPVLLFLLLGIIGVGYLAHARVLYQNGVDVLAQVAAHDPNWRSKVPEEDRRTHCHADPNLPAIEYPDGNDASGSRIALTWHCHIETGWLFDGLPVTVSSEAVIP